MSWEEKDIPLQSSEDTLKSVNIFYLGELDEETKNWCGAYMCFEDNSRSKNNLRKKRPYYDY